MKTFLSIGCVLVAFVASAAFSSAKWLEKRGDDSDVQRLRSAYADCVRRLEAPAENVLVPLETFPDGKVKSRVRAKKAHMFSDSGLIWGEDIRVEQFKEDGSLYASLHAENCVVDRKTKSGWVEGNAVMTYGESSVKGRGIYFSLEDEFVKIFSQSEIRTSHAGFDRRSLLK